MKAMIKNSMHIKAIVNNCFTLIVNCFSRVSCALHLWSLALDVIFFLLSAFSAVYTKNVFICCLVEAVVVDVFFEVMVWFESWSMRDHASTSSVSGGCIKSVFFLDCSSLMQAFILLYSSYSPSVRITQFFNIFILSLLGFLECL